MKYLFFLLLPFAASSQTIKLNAEAGLSTNSVKYSFPAYSVALPNPVSCTGYTIGANAEMPVIGKGSIIAGISYQGLYYANYLDANTAATDKATYSLMKIKAGYLHYFGMFNAGAYLSYHAALSKSINSFFSPAITAGISKGRYRINIEAGLSFGNMAPNNENYSVNENMTSFALCLNYSLFTFK